MCVANKDTLGRVADGKSPIRQPIRTSTKAVTGMAALKPRAHRQQARGDPREEINGDDSNDTSHSTQDKSEDNGENDANDDGGDDVFADGQTIESVSKVDNSEHANEVVGESQDRNNVFGEGPGDGSDYGWL